MSELPREHLTDHDRLTIREAREEIASTPPPANRRPLGCLAGIVGLMVLLVWPSLAGYVPGADFANPFVLMAGVLMLVGGPVAGMLGGGSATAAAGAAVEAALRQLESGDGDREASLRAATLLISHAYVSDGPTTTETFQAAEVRGRVGSSLPLVLAVERVLIEEVGAYPVFTLAEEGDHEGVG